MMGRARTGSAYPRDVVPSGVYFVEAIDHAAMKIGYTSNLAARIRVMALGGPVPMRLLVLGVLPGKAELEYTAHEAFGRFRMHSEWFRFDAKVERLVTALPGLLEVHEAVIAHCRIWAKLGNTRPENIAALERALGACLR